ncbi:hypothetical protein [Actinomadura geliboluensis]|uniref:hypothetical protein n=1 Tax=Actinomadura geliboluensis TaxID=882440 RepID=UPI003698C2FF
MARRTSMRLNHMEAPQGRTRCGHLGPTPGCRTCEAAHQHRRRPGRLRGRGFTKSPKPPKRRRRRR